jgi:cell division protein FtsQ
MQNLPQPLDVRLMNLTATVLFMAVLAAALLAFAGWAMRHPVFAIRAIVVDGEVHHNNAATLRANVLPRLSGNFFTLDLARVRDAFEAVPWVRRAVVRREFPDRLHVTLEEHQAIALWSRAGEDAAARRVGRDRPGFGANLGDLESEDLPRLWAPNAQASEVLATYRRLAPMFARLDATLDALELTERANWRAALDSGAQIELGRGSADEVVQRTARFIDTVAQAAARYGRAADAIESADLRYPNAYALRLRGVSTVAAAPGTPAARPAAPRTAPAGTPPRRTAPQDRRNG